VRSEFDVFAKYQLAHGLLGALPEGLAFLRRINKGETYADLLVVAGKHSDRIPVGNADTAPVDRRLLGKHVRAEQKKQSQGSKHLLWLRSARRSRA